MSALLLESSLTRRQAAPRVATKPIARRVLQVISPSHMSGAEMQLVRLTRAMQARGHVMPVLVKRGSPATDEMRRLNLPVETAAFSGKLNPAALPLIARAARRNRVDLVQSTLSTASWWCGWLEALGGPKSIGHVQGFTSAVWHGRQSHLLAVSCAVRDDLIHQGIAAEKITVLHNVLEPSDLKIQRDPASVRAEFGADANTPVIGAFGHLSVKKGYRELFAGMPRILRSFPDAQLWVVGQGRLRAELEQTARASGFFKSICFVGYRRDAADLMNAIDVMALPSHREPFALVYLEAALLGKPIVACRAGGAVESIADEETGLLVPVGDSGAIADAILALLDNRHWARRLGRAGRDRAQDLFSWPQFIATLEDVYERVLTSRN